jgi:hypothetical protein
MSRSGKRLIQAAKEALAFVEGTADQTGYRIHIPAERGKGVSPTDNNAAAFLALANAIHDCPALYVLVALAAQDLANGLLSPTTYAETLYEIAENLGKDALQ